MATQALYGVFGVAWSVLSVLRTLERIMASLEQQVAVYSQALNLRAQRHQVLARPIHLLSLRKAWAVRLA